ncbi:MAG: CBS domain-containing protein [Desulfobacterales bacterium]
MGETIRQRKVYEIVVPCTRDLQEDLTVRTGDRLTTAVERMIRMNRKAAVVVHNGRVIGMVRLEDALTELGLIRVKE